MMRYFDMNQEERIGNLWVREKETPRHLLNQKADQKLDVVLDIYCQVAGKKITGRKAELLVKKLYVQGFRYLEYLQLRYVYENRLLAFSYNLHYKTSFPAAAWQRELNGCHFIVKTSGKMGIEGALWQDHGSPCGRQEAEPYLQRLNHRLITERIVSLDLTGVRLTYEPTTAEWTVTGKTLIGSATWLLIPPVMSLIKPRPEECAKLLELLALIADAVMAPV